MDPTTLLTVTYGLTVTQSVTGTYLVDGYSFVVLAADPLSVFGVQGALVFILTLFLLVNRFRMWALLLCLIVTLMWVPVSLTGFSLVGLTMVGFFLLIISASKRIVDIFWR